MWCQFVFWLLDHCEHKERSVKQIKLKICQFGGQERGIDLVYYSMNSSLMFANFTLVLGARYHLLFGDWLFGHCGLSRLRFILRGRLSTLLRVN